MKVLAILDKNLKKNNDHLYNNVFFYNVVWISADWRKEFQIRIKMHSFKTWVLHFYLLDPSNKPRQIGL